MTQTNLIGEWLEVQKKVFDYWQDSINLNRKPEQDEKVANIFEEGMKPVQESIKAWVDFSNDLYAQCLKNCNDTQKEILQKMLSGANLYQNLFKLWEDLTLNITGSDSDPMKFVTKWNEEYIKIISRDFVAYLPEQIRDFFNRSFDILTLSGSTMNNFYKPWLDEAQNLQSLLLKSMSGDQAAYIEFNRLWIENFSSSFGKVLNIPLFSMNREHMQKQMQTMNAFVHFLTTTNQFVATMVKVNQDTLEKIIKDYKEKLLTGTNPKTYKEFYEYWWKQNEAAYLKVFGTTEFSKLIAQLLEAGVTFKKDMDDLLEKQLKMLPYPSKTDMDSVYKTLDTLKRDVRALKKEVALLKEERTNGNENGSAEED